ncbi:MAG: alpha/beta hydrolase-fold protein, partial [Spirochaetota bacterium]
MTIETFETAIPQLGGRNRTVRVLLPPSYKTDRQRRYPVLYMQDGHN